MITQYPWVSVKAQERKYIEIGIMITMLIGIITLYSVPTFGNKVTHKEEYKAPPLEVFSIPATIQAPEMIIPIRPSIPVESEDEDIDPDLPLNLFFEPKDVFLLMPPAAPPLPDIFMEPWMVSELPIPVGGYGELMRKVIYPEIAKEVGIQGTVTIEALIGKDGLIKNARVLSGVPKTGLDEAALTAVLQTTFHPALQMGKPVAVRMSIPIVFILK
ncbi:energy transducer TonB [bacterium]|nr:energy transducer TonB [bacterium]